MAPKKPRRGGHATIPDFESAIRSLSEADAMRLRKAAACWARSLRGLGLGMSADDLLQEAVTRTMEDDRHWPKEIDLVVYLTQR